jgi:hypothetical protein
MNGRVGSAKSIEIPEDMRGPDFRSSANAFERCSSDVVCRGRGWHHLTRG